MIILFDTKDDVFRIMDADQNIKEMKSMTKREIYNHLKQEPI